MLFLKKKNHAEVKRPHRFAVASTLKNALERIISRHDLKAWWGWPGLLWSGFYSLLFEYSLHPLTKTWKMWGDDRKILMILQKLLSFSSGFTSRHETLWQKSPTVSFHPQSPSQKSVPWSLLQQLHQEWKPQKLPKCNCLHLADRGLHYRLCLVIIACFVPLAPGRVVLNCNLRRRFLTQTWCVTVMGVKEMTWQSWFWGLTDSWQVKAPLLGAALPQDSHLSTQVKAHHSWWLGAAEWI